MFGGQKRSFMFERLHGNDFEMDVNKTTVINYENEVFINRSRHRSLEHAKSANNF